MHRFGETHQDWADDLCSTSAGHELVCDVTSLEARKDQHVSAALQQTNWVGFLNDFRDDSGVRLHLAVHHQPRFSLPDDLHGLPDLFGRRVLGAPKVGKREESNTGLYVEPTSHFGGADRDLGQFLCPWFDVDLTVCEK